MNQFAAGSDRPTLIIVKSIIAFGSPNKANTSEAHGSPLGEEEVRLTKEAWAGRRMKSSSCPRSARAIRGRDRARGAALRTAWRKKFAEYQQQHPQAAAELQAIWSGQSAGGLGADGSAVCRPMPRAWPPAFRPAKC